MNEEYKNEPKPESTGKKDNSQYLNEMPRLDLAVTDKRRFTANGEKKEEPVCTVADYSEAIAELEQKEPFFFTVPSVKQADVFMAGLEKVVSQYAPSGLLNFKKHMKEQGMDVEIFTIPKIKDITIIRDKQGTKAVINYDVAYMGRESGKGVVASKVGYFKPFFGDTIQQDTLEEGPKAEF